MIKLNQIIFINPQTKVARCQAKVRIHDLCDALVSHDMAVGTLSTIDWETIYGAVTTDTHGGALTVPSPHDFVRGSNPYFEAFQYPDSLLYLLRDGSSM